MTTGDRTQQSGEPLPEIGGKGLFTAELEHGLRERRARSRRSFAQGPADRGRPGRRDRRRLPARGRAGLPRVARRAPARGAAGRRGARHEQPPALRTAPSAASRARAPVDPRQRRHADPQGAGGRVRRDRARGGRCSPARARGRGRRVARAGGASCPLPARARLRFSAAPETSGSSSFSRAIDDAEVRATTTAERTFLGALGGGCAAPVAASRGLLPASASSPSVNLTLAIFASPSPRSSRRRTGLSSCGSTGEGEPRGGRRARWRVRRSQAARTESSRAFVAERSARGSADRRHAPARAGGAARGCARAAGREGRRPPARGDRAGRGRPKARGVAARARSLRLGRLHERERRRDRPRARGGSSPR